MTSELRDLEAKRQHVQSEIALLNRRLEEAKIEAGRRRNELDRLQISLQQAKVAEKEAMERNTPRLGRPKPIPPFHHFPSSQEKEHLPNSPFKKSPYNYLSHCQMDSCFDYSLCPMYSPFHFYPFKYFSNQSLNSADSTSIKTLDKTIRSNEYSTQDKLKSCLFLLFVDTCNPQAVSEIITKNTQQTGRNTVVWLSCKNTSMYRDLMQHPDYFQFIRRSILISETFFKDTYRPKYDLVISHWRKALPSGEIWTHLPPIVPAKRKYLATYLGGGTDHYVQSELLKIQQDDPQSFVFQFSCNIPQYQGKRGGGPSGKGQGGHSEENEVNSGGADPSQGGGGSPDKTPNKLSSLCENDLLRTRLVIDSTFSLIILPPDDNLLLTSDIIQLRLYESLKYGAIPLIIGTRFEPPFSEVIDWSKIIINLPSARITEMHYLLKSFRDADLLAYRRNGRQIFENYLSTMEKITETVLACLRTRIGIAPVPFRDYSSPSVFNESFTPLKLDTFTVDPEEEENLGPIEPPYPSPAFDRNYTLVFLQKYEFWNTYYQPFKLFPYSPWDFTPPSEAKFRGSSLGFRPIAGGAGGSGKEFSQSIGGNLPKEQFTIVMLTYEREQVLMNSLQRLFGLPYLNKVVVVWNSPQAPLADLRWPDIGVPIHVSFS